MEAQLRNAKFNLVCAIGLSSLALPSVAPAASVDYWLIDDGPGAFKITATVTGDDHAGISGYGFDLLGEVTSLQHLSPAAAVCQTAATTGPAGFTLARSKDDVSYVAAFQNIVDLEFVPIYGLGSQASSFSAKGVTPLGTPRSTTWDAELLLARGTYNGSFETLAFNPYGPNSGANVFNAIGESRVRIPESYSFHRVYDDSTTELFARIEHGVAPPAPAPPPWPNAGPPNPPPIPDPLLPFPVPIPPPIAPSESASVEFRLIDSGPGAFKITAKVAGAAQAGLSGYGLDLLGNIMSVQHVSPSSAEVATAGASGPAGFTLARSRDDVSYLAGFQNIVDPNFVPIYGMGSQASSFAAEGITPLDAPRATDWETELLLATGTYSGSFESLSFDPTGPNSGANVFSSVGQTQVRIPESVSFLRVSGSATEVIASFDPQLPVPTAAPLPWPNPSDPPPAPTLDPPPARANDPPIAFDPPAPAEIDVPFPSEPDVALPEEMPEPPAVEPPIEQPTEPELIPPIRYPYMIPPGEILPWIDIVVLDRETYMPWMTTLPVDGSAVILNSVYLAYADVDQPLKTSLDGRSATAAFRFTNASAGSDPSIPEPTGYALAVSALVAFLVKRGRRRTSH